MMFTPFPLLQTERLCLRQLSRKDAIPLFQIRTDDELNKYLPNARPKSMDEILPLIKKLNDGVSENTWIYWAIELLEEKGLIGTICLWNFSEGNKHAEIGYALLKPFQGMGYMHEALNAVIEYGFEVMNLDVIESFTHRFNSASLRLLQQNHFQLTNRTSVDRPDEELVFERRKLI